MKFLGLSFGGKKKRSVNHFLLENPMTQGSMADYEALAEVRLLLEGLPSEDAIVCFCTRSIMRDQDLLFKGIKGEDILRTFYL